MPWTVIMDKLEIKAKIEEKLKKLRPNFIVNLSIDLHIYTRSCIALLDYLMTNMNSQGLYVSLNKPFETISEELKQSNLDASTLYFIDGVSKKTGRYSDSEKCFCLEDPSSITELRLLIDTLINEKKIKFIVVDSLNTLLLYNDIKDVEKFAHNLLNKCRKSNINVVIITPKEKRDEDAVATITQYCDREIEL
jgi:archaellum biogenesis ATPase FlaH